MLVPTANGKVWLCLDPTRLNKTWIKSVHRGPSLRDTILRLVGVKYLTLIDAISGYHNLKLDEKLSNLTFSSPFGR